MTSELWEWPVKLWLLSQITSHVHVQVLPPCCSVSVCPTSYNLKSHKTSPHLAAPLWFDQMGSFAKFCRERESSPTSALSRRGGVKVCSSENQCWVISKTNIRSILLASNAISQDEELAKYPGPSKVSLRRISQPWPDPPGWTNEKPSSQEPDGGILRW